MKKDMDSHGELKLQGFEPLWSSIYAWWHLAGGPAAALLLDFETISLVICVAC